MNILRPYGITLNVSNYRNNPDLFTIDSELQKQIMIDIKSSSLMVLRDTKNASKASLLADFVTVVPKSFQKVIKKLKDEVK